MSEDTKIPHKLTKEESAQIDYLKKIVSASFAKLQAPSFVGLIALSELALVALAQNAKSEQDYLERLDAFYKSYMVPMAKQTAAKSLAYFALARAHPEIIEKTMQKMEDDPTFKVVVVDNKEELDFALMGMPGETTPTKH